MFEPFSPQTSLSRQFTLKHAIKILTLLQRQLTFYFENMSFIHQEFVALNPMNEDLQRHIERKFQKVLTLEDTRRLKHKRRK